MLTGHSSRYRTSNEHQSKPHIHPKTRVVFEVNDAYLPIQKKKSSGPGAVECSGLFQDVLVADLTRFGVNKRHGYRICDRVKL